MKNIRLILVEDNRLLREGLAELLKIHSDMRIVAAFGTNENILQKIGTFKANIILLDLGLQSHNSMQLVKAIKAHYPAMKIIAMDIIPTQAGVLEFVRAGVVGFILKDATIDDFLKTIRSVFQGVKVLPSLLTDSLFSQIVEYAANGTKEPSAKLMESVRMTKREQQIINLVSEGMTNKEIAQKLNLSPYTVKSHVHNILEKLALHTRIQIAKYAHTLQVSQNKAGTNSLL